MSDEHEKLFEFYTGIHHTLILSLNLGAPPSQVMAEKIKFYIQESGRYLKEVKDPGTTDESRDIIFNKLKDLQKGLDDYKNLGNDANPIEGHGITHPMEGMGNTI